MQSLCTIQDLRDSLSERVLIQLTDDSTPPVAVKTAVCQTAIAMATEIVKSRLAGRYSDVNNLPVTPLLKMLALDIATYLLYSRRNKGGIDNVRQRYLDALQHLDKIKLAEETPPGIGLPAQEYKCNKRASDRVYTSDVWRHY